MDIKNKSKTIMKRPYLAWLPFLVWVGMAFALSSQSSPPGAATIGAQAGRHGDILVHMAEYAAGGFLAIFALAVSGLWKRSRLLSVLLAQIIVLAVATVDETIQRFVPGRASSLTDVAIDAIGAAVALVMAGFILHPWRKSSKWEQNV